MATAACTAAESSELAELRSMLGGGSSARRSPPGRAEIMSMPVHAAVHALEQFFEDERVVDAVCDRWRGLSYGPQRRQSASDAGALEVIVKAMEHHRSASAAVTETGCLAIGNIVAGMDESGVARKQRAADAGALAAIVNGMQTHLETAAVQEYGNFAIGNICFAADEAGLVRKQQASDACAISAILTGMRTHSGEAAVQEYGCFALGNVCRGITISAGKADQGDAKSEEAETEEDKAEAARKDAAAAAGKTRKEAAVDAGALETVANAMRFYAKEEGIIQWGSRALSNITFGNSAWREQARKAGAKPQWLVGMADGMDAIEDARHSPNSKTERLAIKAPQPRSSATARPGGSIGGSPPKRAPRIPSKAPPSGVGKMVPLPNAGPLWRDK